MLVAVALSGSGRARAQATRESLCELAPPDEVGELLSLQGVLAPAITTREPVTLCEYLQRGPAMFTVRVRFERGVTPDVFIDARRAYDNAGQPTRDIALGDAAFFSTEPLAVLEVNTLVVLSGDMTLLISSFAPLEGEIALANRILPRL